MFCYDQKVQRQGRLSEKIDIEYEVAREISERELLEINEMLQKEEQYARCEDLDVSFERSDVMNSTTISNSTINQSDDRSGLVQSTKSVTTAGVQMEQVQPEKPKLKVKRKICTDQIKTTCANVSSVCEVSVEMSLQVVKTVCKELYEHDVYLSAAEAWKSASLEQPPSKKPCPPVSARNYESYKCVLASARTISDYKQMLASQVEQDAAVVL